MATTPAPMPRSRRRRWMVIAGIAGVLLLAYALALNWAARRLESDMQRSIRQLPNVEQGHGG